LPALLHLNDGKVVIMPSEQLMVRRGFDGEGAGFNGFALTRDSIAALKNGPR